MTLPISDDTLYKRDGYGCVIPIEKNEETCDQSGHHRYTGTSIADNIVRDDKKWW